MRLPRPGLARTKAEFPPPDRLRALVDGDGRLALRVTPGARQEAIIVDGDRLVVKVRAKPQDGAANEAAIKLLARALDIAPSRIALLRGASSREKLVLIEG